MGDERVNEWKDEWVGGARSAGGPLVVVSLNVDGIDRDGKASVNHWCMQAVNTGVVVPYFEYQAPCGGQAGTLGEGFT